MVVRKIRLSMTNLIINFFVKLRVRVKVKVKSNKHCEVLVSCSNCRLVKD